MISAKYNPPPPKKTNKQTNKQTNKKQTRQNKTTNKQMQKQKTCGVLFRRVESLPCCVRGFWEEK